MRKPLDNGYISNYLIHWTGKDDDSSGARILSIISSTCRLLLSYNPLFSFDYNNHIYEKMVCFTDVPLRHSKVHCSKYGKFGIAFKKQKLINAGAQPVFYFSHVLKRDLSNIFKFIKSQTKETTIDTDVFRALKRHFYFMQNLSDSRANQTDTYYYEREWRLGEQTLATEAELKRPNAKYHRILEGNPPYFGKRVTHEGNSYFVFDPRDVSFIVGPKDWINSVENPHKIEVCVF